MWVPDDILSLVNLLSLFYHLVIYLYKPRCLVDF